MATTTEQMNMIDLLLIIVVFIFAILPFIQTFFKQIFKVIMIVIGLWLMIWGVGNAFISLSQSSLLLNNFIRRLPMLISLEQNIIHSQTFKYGNDFINMIGFPPTASSLASTSTNIYEDEAEFIQTTKKKNKEKQHNNNNNDNRKKKMKKSIGKTQRDNYYKQQAGGGDYYQDEWDDGVEFSEEKENDDYEIYRERQ